MIPRKKIDIGWRDLAVGLRAALINKPAPKIRIAERNVLTTLSVRSGFDLILQKLNLAKGSEVLVSAITIRDMVKIIEAHGLVAVPVDISPETGAVDVAALEKRITSKTQAVLIAHLFGARNSLEPIIDVAQKHNLYLFEDCAQAFMADDYWGHPQSDFAMFSFGTIKTATALGGGLIIFKDQSIFEAVEHLQCNYPEQARATFAKRLLKYSLLKAISYEIPYTIFTAALKLLGKPHDSLINQMVRGFSAAELITQIRHRPSNPLRTLLARRLSLYPQERIKQRSASGALLASQLGTSAIPARQAANHSYWVFPITTEKPQAFIEFLCHHGVDASQGASSMYAVPATGNSQARGAEEIMQQIVYLPFYDGISLKHIAQIAAAVASYSASNDALLTDS